MRNLIFAWDFDFFSRAERLEADRRCTAVDREYGCKEDGVEQKAWICGPPSHQIEFLKEIEEKYPGLENIILHWPEGMPRDEYLSQLRIFAKEVMPTFTER